MCVVTKNLQKYIVLTVKTTVLDHDYNSLNMPPSYCYVSNRTGFGNQTLRSHDNAMY